MTIITVTTSSYLIPYNGYVDVTQTLYGSRVVHRYVQWRDKPDGVVTDEVIAPNGVSKVNLVKAIYWFGTSISGRSNRRLEKEARRPGSTYTEIQKVSFKVEPVFAEA